MTTDVQHTASPLTYGDSVATRLGVTVSHLSLLGEFDSTERQCGGLTLVPDAGPESDHTDNDRAAYADSGGRHSWTRAVSLRGPRSIGGLIGQLSPA
jgi:hypothetical protein